MNPIVIVRRLVQTLVAPVRVAGEVGGDRIEGEGAYPVVLLGLAWAMLCAVLYARGHAPTFALLPIPRAHYYLAQALFVVPVTLLSWRILTSVTARVASVRDAEQRSHLSCALGYVYAAPMLFAFIAVDAMVYAIGGFAALSRYIRFYAPIAPLWTLVLTTVTVRVVARVSNRRAFLAACAGLFTQAFFAGIFLR